MSEMFIFQDVIGMDTKVEPPPDFLATKTATSVGRCYPTLMSRTIIFADIMKKIKMWDNAILSKKFFACVDFLFFAGRNTSNLFLTEENVDFQEKKW
ncbi:MAG: hypothetical protein FWC50_00970 [Planctomycetaceae bacterium]|nr:hypothetical protein [Planctomycetaceae bacterium]